MHVQFFEVEEFYKDAIKKYKEAATQFEKGSVAHAAYALALGSKSFGSAEGILQYSRLSGREQDKASLLSLETEMRFHAAISAMNNNRNIR